MRKEVYIKDKSGSCYGIISFDSYELSLDSNIKFIYFYLSGEIVSSFRYCSFSLECDGSNKYVLTIN